MTSVSIGEGVTSIANNAFKGCSGLEDVYCLGEKAPSAGNNSFAFQSEDVSNTTLHVKDYAIESFKGKGPWTYFKEIVCDEKVTDFNLTYYVDNEVFKTYKHKYDDSITPEPEPTKKGYTFSGWSEIPKTMPGKDVDVKGSFNSASEVTLNNVIYRAVDNENNYATIIGNDNASGDVVIASSVNFGDYTYKVNSIGNKAFYGCSSITSVTVGDEITSIASNAFTGCSSLDNMKVIVSDLSTFCNNNVVGLIGSYVGKPVILIDNEGNEIKDYIIPDGVTSIGESAFRNCSGLTSITVPNSLTNLGKNAFAGCSGLTSITMPQSTSVIIPQTESSIYDYAFSGCSTSIDLKVVVSDYSTFCNNNVVGLIGSYVGKPVILIDSEGNEIKDYVIPEGVTSIGESAFQNCCGLTSFTIPKSVTTIGDYALQGCKNLVSAVIGSGVTSIGKDAFSNTNLLKTIWLTNTPPSGYEYASCAINYVSNDQFSSLNNVVEYQFLSSYFDVDGIRYVPVSPSERTCDAIDCAYNESAENINIGKEITNKGITLSVKKMNPYTCYGNQYIKNVELSFEGIIGESAFENCSALISAEISNGGSIDSCAFRRCSSLYTATIKNQGSIGDHAFYKCDSLETAELGIGVTSIGKEAFTDCAKLKSIVIPDSVKSIGPFAFQGCVEMISAQIGNGLGGIEEYTFSGCSSLEELTIGSQVKTIGQYAFQDCKSLPAVTIPQSVTEIKEYVFSECSELKKVIMSDGDEVLTLSSNGGNPIFSSCPLDSVYIGRNINYDTTQEHGYSPFYLNTSLKAVTITDKETEVTAKEFFGCSNLQSVIVGSRVAKIGDFAFSGCSVLNTVIMSDGVSLLTLGSNGNTPLFSSCPLDSVYIGRNINYNTTQELGYSPFYRNASLRAIKIADIETEISANEFYGCTNLKSVDIGNGVRTIGDWAFSGCSSLMYFAFGSRMQTIGKEAFSDCTAVVEINSKSGVPPTCASQALDDINKWECKLYVPNGCIAIYQAANQWKEFFFIEENGFDSELKGDANCDGMVNAADIVIVVNYIMDNKTDNIHISAADANGDGVINAEDISKIVNIIMGK